MCVGQVVQVAGGGGGIGRHRHTRHGRIGRQEGQPESRGHYHACILSSPQNPTVPGMTHPDQSPHNKWGRQVEGEKNQSYTYIYTWDEFPHLPPLEIVYVLSKTHMNDNEYLKIMG